ncbi:hypothetical protein [Roseivirga echinicomitans]|nr:hypothetical protein [Roseivirga echinicomitans]
MSPIFQDLASVFFWIIRRLKPRTYIYCLISHNQLEFHNRMNAYSQESRKAVANFSSERLLIANSDIAINSGKLLLQEVCNSNIKMSNIYLLIHPIENGFNNISPVEEMIYNDFGGSIGASGVIIVKEESQLTDKEIDKKIISLNK